MSGVLELARESAMKYLEEQKWELPVVLYCGSKKVHSNCVVSSRSRLGEKAFELLERQILQVAEKAEGKIISQKIILDNLKKG